MAKLRIARDVLKHTQEKSVLTDEERSAVERLIGPGDAKGSVTADVAEFPVAFLRALLDDDRLSPNQRAVVVLRLHGMSDDKLDRAAVFATAAHNPAEFAGLFTSLGVKSPNCEMFLNGRWYPVTLNAQVVKGYEDGRRRRAAVLLGTLSLCEMVHGVWHCVYPELFMDESGHRRPRTVAEVLARFGLRAVQTPAADFNLKLVRAERTAREPGQVALVTGPVMVSPRYAWWPRLESCALGTLDLPRKAVVEPDLEVAQDNRAYYAPHGQNQQAVSRLPFVRVFSLDTKSYVYADVDDVTPYEFDDQAMGRLHLPPAMLGVLTRVFHTPASGLFGDLIKGKHGGAIILACGNPGVGKTLTAEVYAEHTRRPLYVLELGELGTNVAQVEENLQRVFTRVARWNAVLQFDECEIFLAKRGDDLERSAIVGIFLRLLDYYQGILFLTTNRAQVLDHAVLSRVMLKLEYPDLDRPARAVIWRQMLSAAGLALADGSPDDLAESEINGRQIRNLTRLAKILYAGGQVTLSQMRDVLRFGCA